MTVLTSAGTASAQGRGNGVGKQPRTGPQAPVQTSSQLAGVTLPPSPSFPQFGIWLDDATTAARGGGSVSIGASYWRGSGANQIDAPILSATYGIANRAHVAATVPFYRASYTGFSGSGLDNVYISGKIAVIDPNAGAGRFGVAVGGVAEILSAGFADASRVHWAAPLSMELRGGGFRLYGSTGYFSRGAFFTASALEWTAPTGTSLTGSIAHSSSVHGITMATTATVPHADLLDTSVFVSQPISNMASLYAAGSRTFSGTWIGGASSVSAGLSFRFAGAARE